MKKGIFCLENNWTESIRNKLSVQHILELFDKANICENIYHKCGTYEEFKFMLSRWKLAQTKTKFPILYLAFHGEKEGICIGKKIISITELGTLLMDNCKGKIIFFASCDTMNMHENKIQSFLRKTDALAVIGYKSTVDWMKATAFELLALEQLQKVKFDLRGMPKAKRKIVDDLGKMFKELEVRMIVRKI